MSTGSDELSPRKVRGCADNISLPLIDTFHNFSVSGKISDLGRLVKLTPFHEKTVT